MQAYEGKIHFTNDLAPMITVRHRGRDRCFLTMSEPAWSRRAYIDLFSFHLLSYNPDSKEYLLETLEPRGLSVRRLHATAEAASLQSEGISGNEGIVSRMVTLLQYDPNAFVKIHESARVKFEKKREALTTDPYEEAFYASIMNAHRLTATHRAKIRSELLPRLMPPNLGA